VPTWGAILFGLLVWLVEAAKANAGSWLLWGIVGAVVGLALAMGRGKKT
jgi:flagellar motor component MotA